MHGDAVGLMAFQIMQIMCYDMQCWTPMGKCRWQATHCSPLPSSKHYMSEYSVQEHCSSFQ